MHIREEGTMEAAEILKYVLGLLQVLVTAWCWHMYSELGKTRDANDKLTKELAEHKLHTAETYMTKTELTRAFDTINRSIESLSASITSRFDKMEEKLDRKADRP